MKKALIITLCCLLVFTGLTIQGFAKAPSYSWYCAHVKEHVQPICGTELRFAEELDGYYLDHTHSQMSDADKVIYLTFDAGYENGNIAKTLDVLKEEGVKGAFFILGNLIRHDTELVRRMAKEGHTVCNHTLRHKDMSQMNEADFLDELHALESLYEKEIGEKLAPYYRPPEGKFNRENLTVSQKNGYKTIFWSFAYPDWDNNKQMSLEKAKSVILENVHNGEVMLLHPTSETNAAILGDVIRELKQQGFRFGTLDELTKRVGEAQ